MVLNFICKPDIPRVLNGYLNYGVWETLKVDLKIKLNRTQFKDNSYLWYQNVINTNKLREKYLDQE